MKSAVIYVHGKGGSASESEHYRPLFPKSDVIGFDYSSNTPWEAESEFYGYFSALSGEYDTVVLVANSIGAFFSMSAGIDRLISRAYFISPVVDMEKLITDMIAAAGATEDELEEKGVIRTGFGEDLSWRYLTYVRSHPVVWNAPTDILFGENDRLVSYDSVSGFASAHGSRLTVMPGGAHWFASDAQMRFLDEWIRNGENGKRRQIIR